ncbi:acyl-CoA synthetase [Aeromicrobium sp. 179-A 4D2 NHS]|uniref:acyl-CoA synthetase n=1 Tax=Aeromicrobium sp. 179-A 4D2 NHS TaxID=3142375 RepID=UPI0039A36C92
MSLSHIALGTWFTARADRTPDRRALTFEGRTATFREVADRVERFAAVLADGGVTPGDRVAFLGFNQPAALEVLMAAARLGAVYVSLNHRLAAEEIGFVLRDAGVHTAVVDADHAPTLAAASFAGRLLVVGEGYDEAIAAAAPLAQHPVVQPDDLAILMYTSGTTGTPKGVMLSHANLWWSTANLATQFDVLRDDVTLTMAPLFHIAGLNVTTLSTWLHGGEVVLHRSFDVDRVLDDIARYGVTTVFGVPAMFGMIERSPRFADADLGTVRMAICGGAPVPESLLRSWLDKGIAMLQGYGLTETAPAASFLSADQALARLGSAGRPPLYVDLKLDDGGRPVTEPFERGEICLRGANVTRGYWNRPDATAEAIDADGWFHTGDVGYRDEDGYLFVVDRLKDMVISGGENIYPAEVENVLYQHPAILEVAVVGLPDEEWGETVAAFVVLQEDASLTLEELRAFAGERLARYKLPRRLEVVPLLPRNASGKVQKPHLRTQVC